MNINEVIKYPILTEKTYAQMAEGVYTFAVDTRTNKKEVKNVVEFIFEVKVDKVNIHNYAKKPKKLGKFKGFTNKVKKAVIYLKEGQINIFPDENAVEQPKDVKAIDKKSDAPKEMSDAEKKAAEKIAAKIKEKEIHSDQPKVDAPIKEEAKPVVAEEETNEEAK